jgi:hypothetical protein
VLEQFFFFTFHANYLKSVEKISWISILLIFSIQTVGTFNLGMLKSWKIETIPYAGAIWEGFFQKLCRTEAANGDRNLEMVSLKL